MSDPKAQALFETAAEVLVGLAKAFGDFEQKHEKAWKLVSVVVNHEMVAGVGPQRPETPVLVLPFRFELIRKAA